MPNPSNQRRFHDSSLRLARASGTGVLESSLDAGWSSLLVVRRGVPLAKESFETPAVEDFHIGLVVRGVSDFTGVHEGRTYTTRKEPGHVTLAAPTETYRMSWARCFRYFSRPCTSPKLPRSIAGQGRRWRGERCAPWGWAIRSWGR